MRSATMKGMGGTLAVLMVVSGCTSTAKPTPTPSPTPTPLPANFERYVGAYRTTDGVIFVINGHGHLLNLRDSAFRQLYPTAMPDRLITGRMFAVASPVEADVSFRMVGNRADQFTMRPVGRPAITADRMPFKETDVQVPVNGAVLAATITEPLTAAPHAGIVIVHGSGLGPRVDYGVWVGLYASLGMTVLAYDKRGNGQSTGSYPGEFPTEDNLNIYASDAAAVLRYLVSWPGSIRGGLASTAAARVGGPYRSRFNVSAHQQPLRYSPRARPSAWINRASGPASPRARRRC